MSYFVTGTDTDIGKTIFSAYLTKCGGGKYWKPIQCGEPSDEETVRDLVGSTKVHPSAYKLKHPLSPHRASELEGIDLDITTTHCKMPLGPQPLIVEGAGGVYVPITWEHNMMDLMSHLGLPVILVAKSSLGTLNHSLLSIEALKKRNLNIHSVVMVGPPNESNRQTIERLSKIPVFEFPWLENLENFEYLDLKLGYGFFWA